MKIERLPGWSAVLPVVGIVLTASGAIFALRSADSSSLERWRSRLLDTTEQRAAAVAGVVHHGRAIARLAANYPSVRYLAAGRDDAPRPFPQEEGASLHVSGLFTDLVGALEFDAVYLVAADGRVLASSGDAMASSEDREVAAAAMEGATTVVHAQTSPDGTGRLRYAAPVRDASRLEVLGAVVVREEVGTRLARILVPPPEGGTLALHVSAGARIASSDVDAPPTRAATEVAAGGSTTPTLVEDERSDGTAVVAAALRVDSVPWILEAVVVRSAALGPGRRWVIWGAAAVGMAAIGAALALGGRRARRAAAEQAAMLLWTERLGQALDEGDDLVLFADGQGVVREARGAAGEFYGAAPKDLVGRHVSELGVDVAVPSIPVGETLRVETYVRRLDGESVAVEVALQRVGVGTPGAAVLVHVRDVRRRRAAEDRILLLNRLLRLRSVLSHTLRDARSRQDVFDVVARAAVDAGGFPFAWIGEVRADGNVVPVAAAGAALEVAERLAGRWVGPREALGPDGRAVVERRTVLCADGGDGADAAYLSRGRPLGFRSMVATPFGGASSSAEGVVALHADERIPSDGEVIAVAEAVAADVTGALERVSARDREREANERLLAVDASYQLLFDANPWPMWVYDLEDLRILRVNEAAIRVYGWEREAFLARTVIDLRPPQDRGEAASFFASCPPASGYALRTRHIRSDGTPFPVRVVATPLTFLGRAARLVLAEDLTDRHRAEEATRILVRAVEQSPVSIVITDRAGAIEYVNPHFEHVTGYTRDEVMGQNPRLLKSDRTPQAVYEELWRTILAGGTWRGEILNRRKDGTVFAELATVAPVHDAAGAITHFVAVKEDLTDRHAMEARARSAEEMFLQAQKLEAVGRLAGGIAHDFNNLLCVILGYSQLAASSLGDAHPEAERLQQVVAAGKRAEALTRQLLAFSRRQVLQPRVVDLHEVLRGLEKLLRRLIGEDIDLRIELSAGTPVVRVDPGQLEQVVINLAVNARDAMPSGGTLTIRTEIRRVDGAAAFVGEQVAPGAWVVVSVEDTGTGIDEATQAHLFEPFFTTKAEGLGTGLGLATVHGIVRQSGGHVGFSSRVGQGTRFEVWLPRLETTGPDERRDEVVDLEALRGSETVLLVEDQEGVRELVRTWLEAFGYAVIDAGDGEQALARAFQVGRTIDLLLTDVVMPKMGGRALADRLRARWPGLRVVYMSGYPSDVLSRQGVLEPGIRLVEKPLSQTAVLRVLRAAMAAPPQ